ncbi:uncharacterized protein I303_106264 [Kwoniella dejecticola CBS 10117]|uniref:N-acetyltransferase domain-containing protein n=1 Tax=Kwoniella dejecticola CBS 10117 TaxID=1296121 RepID=A0A1A6A1R0_9TREE|nr:uncharacterized protein I303_06283 [Kwoniella dejecticola CBS 10117]OBR83996.1 hypothetical protein I303_06283 [Kwoniella dejecticola CBS 10117]
MSFMKIHLPIPNLSPDKVKLVPFEVDEHLMALWEGTKDTPVIFSGMNDGPFDDIEGMRKWMTKHLADPNRLEFAIFTTPAKDPQGTEKVFAGRIALKDIDLEKRTAAVGIIVLKDYQRTHVNTHATSIVLRLAFDEFRLKKVKWSTSTSNIQSQRAALRLGFKHSAEHEDSRGRHDRWGASISSEQWRESVKDHVDNLVVRGHIS